MTRPPIEHVVVIGAGSAGLMAARELARAGKRVTILEARDRCGGRIFPLPPAEFGYRAEGGAEFVHGEAPVTRGLSREAGLLLKPIQGARWNVKGANFSRDQARDEGADRLNRLLAELTSDVTIAQFLQRHFAGPEYGGLRHSITRMVESYDAADPARASTLALRDEWMAGDRGPQARIIGGYGALIDFLVAECRKLDVRIHFDAVVDVIDETDGRAMVRCINGDRHLADVAILTVPLPLLADIMLPPDARETVAGADIGYGNVIKLLLKFQTRWWLSGKGHDLSDLLFLVSDRTVRVWWTQYPSDHAVLTGWFAGPKTNGMAGLDENQLVDIGLASLADIFACSVDELKRDVVAARAIDWAKDRFARGAYSYATLGTREAQSKLAKCHDGAIFFSGEALYGGRDMGTVEAALASGLETARAILAK